MHVAVPGVERCEIGLAGIYMSLYLVFKGVKVPGFYMCVTVPGVEGYQMCLGFTCVLLYRV